MATKDKLINLEDLKVLSDHVEGEVTDLKSDLTNIRHAFVDFASFGLSKTIPVFINTSNLWSESGSPAPFSAIVKIPERAEYVRIIANNDADAIIAFLTTNAYQVGAEASYASGTGKIYVSAGREAEYPVPNDAQYIYVFISRSGTTYQPTTAEFGMYQDFSADIENIEAITTKTTQNTLAWAVGSINYPNGNDYTSTSRIRSGFVDGIAGLSALDGYEMALFAWDKTTNAYVGALMVGGSFATEGTLAWVKSCLTAAMSEYKFKVVLRNANDPTATMTTSESVNCLFIVRAIDDTLTISGEAADAKVTGDRINVLDATVFANRNIDFSIEGTKNFIIASPTGKWSGYDGNVSYFIPVPDGAVSTLITANDTAPAVVGLLKTATTTWDETPDYATGASRTRINAGESKEFIFPSDCNYICIMKSVGSSPSVDYTPASMTIKEPSFATDTRIIPLGLHEMPRNTSALNIVKRCRQLTDIKWTPAVDLPRFMLVQRGGVIPESAEAQNYLGTFKAGVEYTGAPYGRVSSTMDEYGIDFATVGHYIDFETFVSSVFNANSKLCSENVGSVSEHRSTIYATVCSGMTCYALDVAEVPTALIPSISGLTRIGKLNDSGTLLGDKYFQIGDVLNKQSYHTAIITDIIRDDDGVIQFVELSDASTAGLADRNYSDGQIGGICRRKGWTREQLFDLSSWGEYELYRYGGVVSYTPSKYVNVGDEFNMQRIEYFPCMPYEGNKFTYKTGYVPNNSVKILISLGGYSYLKVFKNGTEITGSPFAVTNETESIDISEISEGVYTAYLCNISDGEVSNLTYPCEWTIST